MKESVLIYLLLNLLRTQAMQKRARPLWTRAQLCNNRDTAVARAEGRKAYAADRPLEAAGNTVAPTAPVERDKHMAVLTNQQQGAGQMNKQVRYKCACVRWFDQLDGQTNCGVISQIIYKL